MFSAIFDVAVGLILVYLILSVVTSAISEVIGNSLNQRARGLEIFIANTLAHSDIPVKDFYEKTLLAPNMQDKQRPSYIQAGDFVEALFSMLRETKLGSPAAAGQAVIAMSLDDLKNVASALPADSPLKSVLTGALNKAITDPALKDIESQVEQVRQTLEKWFDNSMDHVSGWYKRWSHDIILAIGLVLAIAFNIDSLAITNNLLQNPALREAIQAKAGAVSQTLSASVAPAAPGSAPAATPSPNDTAATLQFISSLQMQLNGLSLPVGWPDPGLGTADFSWWVKKLVGLLITAFAISQGAPFWFDLLNKITNLRSGAKPPDKSTTAAG